MQGTPKDEMTSGTRVSLQYIQKDLTDLRGDFIRKFDAFELKVDSLVKLANDKEEIYNARFVSKEMAQKEHENIWKSVSDGHAEVIKKLDLMDMNGTIRDTQFAELKSEVEKYKNRVIGGWLVVGLVWVFITFALPYLMK